MDKKREKEEKKKREYFFFNDTATTEIYTLSLHDALPISGDFNIPPPNANYINWKVVLGENKSVTFVINGVAKKVSDVSFVMSDYHYFSTNRDFGTSRGEAVYLKDFVCYNGTSYSVAPPATISSITVNNTNPFVGEILNLSATTTEATSCTLFNNVTNLLTTSTYSNNQCETTFTVPYYGATYEFVLNITDAASSTTLSVTSPVYKTIYGNPISWSWKSIACDTATGIRNGNAVSWSWT